MTDVTILRLDHRCCISGHRRCARDRCVARLFDLAEGRPGIADSLR